jgi:hypothetical protein
MAGVEALRLVEPPETDDAEAKKQRRSPGPAVVASDLVPGNENKLVAIWIVDEDGVGAWSHAKIVPGTMCEDGFSAELIESQVRAMLAIRYAFSVVGYRSRLLSAGGDLRAAGKH